MSYFDFLAERSGAEIIREFYSKNWFTGLLAPSELSMFFSGGWEVFETPTYAVGRVVTDFKYKFLDLVMYFGAGLSLFFSKFSPGALFYVLFVLGLLFSLTRFGLFYFFLFKYGLKKKGYKGTFKLRFKKYVPETKEQHNHISAQELLK